MHIFAIDFTFRKHVQSPVQNQKREPAKKYFLCADRKILLSGKRCLIRFFDDPAGMNNGFTDSTNNENMRKRISR